MISIEVAKKSLEKEVIHIPNVYGIGVVFSNGEKVIEVSVSDEETKTNILQRLPNSKWNGYVVNVIIREQTNLY